MPSSIIKCLYFTYKHPCKNLLLINKWNRNKRLCPIKSNKSGYFYKFGLLKSKYIHRNIICGNNNNTDRSNSSQYTDKTIPIDNIEDESKTNDDVLFRIIPLGFMFFCIIFNYSILRDTKDVLVITAPGSGAEILPFLKTWVNLPLSIGFMIMYSKLLNVLSPEVLFYVVIFPFILFFGSFAYLIYPNREMFHLNHLADSLVQKYGHSVMGVSSILRNWTFCVFYVVAELWGSFVVSVLFWGFSNQIIKIEEAKKYYPMFGMGANCALILSGQTIKYFSNFRNSLTLNVDGWAITLKSMMNVVVGFGWCIVLTYFFMNRFLKPKLINVEVEGDNGENLTLLESLLYIMKSKYIRNIAIIVISYGICINLVEVTWKSKVKVMYTNPNEYSYFMGNFSTYTGFVTLIMTFFSKYIFKKFGWRLASLITPIVLCVTGLMFFIIIVSKNSQESSLYYAILIGGVQNIAAKSTKYVLFDPCKEIAFIPMDYKKRTKGKAIIDVICNPIGKSGGALIQQVMILTYGSIFKSIPYLAVILLLVTFVWIMAVESLNKQFIKDEHI